MSFLLVICAKACTYKALWTRFHGQHFFNENRAQFCSYLVKRFWLGVALCSRKDFVQITVEKNVVFEWVIIGANHASSLEHIFVTDTLAKTVIALCTIKLGLAFSRSFQTFSLTQDLTQI